MAIISNFLCTCCNTVVNEVIQPNSNWCSDCRSRLRNKLKDLYHEKKRQLTLEQRVEELEEWIYNHSNKSHVSPQVY